MTKSQYMTEHPRSILARNLALCDWPDTTLITIVGGLDAPENPRSNLFQALRRSRLQSYVVGGHRRRGTEGWWFAVA